jgi:hypothetical protein
MAAVTIKRGSCELHLCIVSPGRLGGAATARIRPEETAAVREGD